MNPFRLCLAAVDAAAWLALGLLVTLVGEPVQAELCDDDEPDDDPLTDWPELRRCSVHTVGIDLADISALRDADEVLALIGDQW